jgi:hypothetical protein
VSAFLKMQSILKITNKKSYYDNNKIYLQKISILFVSIVRGFVHDTDPKKIKYILKNHTYNGYKEHWKVFVYFLLIFFRGTHGYPPFFIGFLDEKLSFFPSRLYGVNKLLSYIIIKNIFSVKTLKNNVMDKEYRRVSIFENAAISKNRFNILLLL